MKSILSLIACLGILLASASQGDAADQEPSLRETKDWIVISGISDGENGPLPWSFAIKKSTILSVTIDTHHRVLFDNGKPVKYRGASLEEIDNLPANIRVSTSELTGSGNRIFHITGLTHATAPLLLEKMLAAIDSRDAVNGGK